jgi:hypothetical protein
MKTTWFFPRFFQRNRPLQNHFGFCFEVLEFYVSYDGKNGIAQLSMLNVMPLLFINLFIYSSFIQVWWWHVHQRHQTNVRKLSNVLCVFFPIVSLFLVCFVFVFLLMLTSSRSVQCVLCNRNCCAFHFTYHHPHVFFICPPFQITSTCDCLLLLSPISLFQLPWNFQF